MDDMHFQVHQFSINRVLTWRMEMELMCEEVSPWDVLVEQVDGRSVHVVERSLLVVGSLNLFQREVIGFHLLIELVGGTGIYGLIVEFEFFVLDYCF